MRDSLSSVDPLFSDVVICLNCYLCDAVLLFLGLSSESEQSVIPDNGDLLIPTLVA